MFLHFIMLDGSKFGVPFLFIEFRRASALSMQSEIQQTNKRTQNNVCQRGQRLIEEQLAL